MSGARTYGGWQAEKVTFLFGLSTTRTALTLAAVVALIVPIAQTKLREGLVAWPLAVLLASAAFVRVAGRTVDEWAVTAASFGVNRARRRTRFVSGPFAPPGADPAEPPPVDLPGILAPLRFLSAPDGAGGQLAVVHHPLERTYTAVARVSFPGIGLVDSGRRNQRVAGWGALIASLCTEGNPITRVQTLQRVVPETGAQLRQWHLTHLDRDAPALAAQVARDLVDRAAPAGAARENYLAFTLDASRAQAAIRAAGGGDSGACAVLVRQVRALLAAINSASLEIGAWLGPRELAGVIRTGFDPHEGAVLAERRARYEADPRGAGLEPGTDPHQAGPAAATNLWGVYRHDGAWTASFAVGTWPRSEVYANFLLPLLTDTAGHRRAFSLHIEPLWPRAAARAVMAERTKRQAGVALRARTGQIVPEDERRAQRQAERQDAERAAGHGLVRLTGYVSVTVVDPDQLEGAIAALQADAGSARIELRRMWGAQDVGFAVSSLPLGLGLPKTRW